MPLRTAPEKDAWLERLYSAVANEEDARACSDIPDEACREVPGNFFIIAAVNALTNLGDALASPKTVLTWLMVFVSAPASLIAMLVPIRESGSMIPQIFMGAVIRRRPRRKSIWILGSLLQCLAVAGVGLTVLFSTGITAGWLIILCLVVFSLSRGLCSVSSKDIVGKTIPKGRRGRLGGISAGVAGVLTVTFGIFMSVRGRHIDSVTFYAGLLFTAGGLWLLAVLIFSRLREFPGETEGGGNAFIMAIGRLDLLRTDAAFRNFVLTRALMITSGLVAPFYIVLAQSRAGTTASTLGVFIVAGGLASSLSAPIWGILADRSSKRVLILAACVASGLGIVVFTLENIAPTVAATFWFFPLAFFVLSVAHSGVRAGRKTYLVDLAGGVKRTDYVSVSNTVIGVFLLLIGFLTSLLSFMEAEELILTLSLVGLLGAALGTRLPEAE